MGLTKATKKKHGTARRGEKQVRYKMKKLDMPKVVRKRETNRSGSYEVERGTTRLGRIYSCHAPIRGVPLTGKRTLCHPWVDGKV